MSQESLQKSDQPQSNKTLFPGREMSGGPWSSSLARALFRQETVVRAAVEALFEILAEKVSWIRNLRNKLNGLLKNVAKTLFHVVSIAVFF